MTSGDLSGATLAQGLLDSLGVALWEALDTVFLVAAFAAAEFMGFAFFFSVTVRSEHVPGDSKHQHIAKKMHVIHAAF